MCVEKFSYWTKEIIQFSGIRDDKIVYATRLNRKQFKNTRQFERRKYYDGDEVRPTLSTSGKVENSLFFSFKSLLSLMNREYVQCSNITVQNTNIKPFGLNWMWFFLSWNENVHRMFIQLYLYVFCIQIPN